MGGTVKMSRYLQGGVQGVKFGAREYGKEAQLIVKENFAACRILLLGYHESQYLDVRGDTYLSTLPWYVW